MHELHWRSSAALNIMQCQAPACRACRKVSPQRLACAAVLQVHALRAEQARAGTAAAGTAQRRQRRHGQACEGPRQLAKGIAAAAAWEAAWESQGLARGGGRAARGIRDRGCTPRGGRRQPLLRRLLQRVCGQHVAGWGARQRGVGRS